MKTKKKKPKEAPLSRQRLWQIRQRKLGRCRSCSKLANGASYCHSCRERNKRAYRELHPPAFHCGHCGEKGHNVRTCALARKARREAVRVAKLAQAGVKRDRTEENAKKRERRRLLSEGWPPPPKPKKPKKEFKGWPK